MCLGCWEERGSPQIDSPPVRYAAGLIARLYEEISIVGAPLHAQLDDWNIEGDFFSGVKEKDFWMPDYVDLDDEQRSLADECWAAMCSLTDAERASALALEGGYWR